MGFFGFYISAVERAFVESISVAQAVVFVLVVAVGWFEPHLRDPAATHARVTGGRFAVVLLIALVCARLPFAIYGMWQDEHAARLHAECLVTRDHDAQQQRKEFIAQKMQSFYGRVEKLQVPITADQFPAWATQVQALGTEMTDWIRANMGDGAATKLGDMDGPSYDFMPMHPVNSAHISMLNWLNKTAKNLTTLQTEPEWDTHEPAASPECS